MSGFKTNRENEILKNYAVSAAVDSKILDKGTFQIDQAISNIQKVDTALDDEILLKKRLLVLMTEAKKSGMTPNIRSEILEIRRKLQSISAPQITVSERIETQEIVRSYDEMVVSNREFAEKYDINLSNPFLDSFSNIERTVITNELSEKFDLLKLDKYDYAFAAAVGLIGGIIDALLVGTASNKFENIGKLAQFTDKGFDKLVQQYARHNGWKGARKASANSTKSAIGFLEKKFPVNYDARYTKDVQYLFTGLNPSNHHLLSLDHSPLGLLIGVIDILQGKATFFCHDTGKFMRIPAEKNSEINGVCKAIHRWFGHCVSDVAGASGSKTRGSGLPTGMESILQTFNFGKIPISNKKYGTIAETSVKMYENGFDLRFSVATAIPVVLCDILIRIYWFYKQFFFYGESIKNSVPFGKHRELQRMLLITSLCFETVDTTHAIVKGSIEQNPMTMLNSLNYIGLMNFGYKLFANFRLEHEHNSKIKELMKNEIRLKHNDLINSA